MILCVAMPLSEVMRSVQPSPVHCIQTPAANGTGCDKFRGEHVYIRVCIYMYVYKDNVFFLFTYFSVPGSA